MPCDAEGGAARSRAATIAGMRPAAPLLLGLVLACDSSPAAKPAEPAKAGPTEPEPEPAPTKAKPAEPEPLPPAPEGAAAIDGVYVQTCAAPHACPQLHQDAGAAHCKGLTLGALAWALPTLEQLESWKGQASLQGFDVFHWSGTPWDEDPEQWWIYDPGSGSKTTARPDRKPFTVRCVARPAGG